MTNFEQEVAEIRAWFQSPRFSGITRIHTARDVAEQRGTIRGDYRVAREAAEGFHARLRELFAQGKGVTEIGVYEVARKFFSIIWALEIKFNALSIHF